MCHCESYIEMHPLFSIFYNEIITWSLSSFLRTKISKYRYLTCCDNVMEISTSWGKLVVCPLYSYCPIIEFITYKIGLAHVIKISSTCLRIPRTRGYAPRSIWIQAKNMWQAPSLLHILHIRPVFMFTTWIPIYDSSHTWHI